MLTSLLIGSLQLKLIMRLRNDRVYSKEKFVVNTYDITFKWIFILYTALIIDIILVKPIYILWSGLLINLPLFNILFYMLTTTTIMVGSSRSEVDGQIVEDTIWFEIKKDQLNEEVDNVKAEVQEDITEMKHDIKENYENVKEDLKEGFDKVKKETKESYEDVKEEVTKDFNKAQDKAENAAEKTKES